MTTPVTQWYGFMDLKGRVASSRRSEGETLRSEMIKWHRRQAWMIFWWRHHLKTRRVQDYCRLSKTLEERVTEHVRTCTMVDKIVSF